MFFDPSQRISKVDKQLCEYIAENYKPCVFVVNKWDLMAASMPTSKVGPLPARFVSHHALRADRVRHRPDGQERQGAAQSCADAFQAVAGAGLDFAEINRVIRDALQRTPPPLAARTSGRRFTTPPRSAPSRPRSCCSATTRNHWTQPISGICWAYCANGCRSAKCRSSSTCDAAKPGDGRDEIERETFGRLACNWWASPTNPLVIAQSRANR